MVAQYLLYACCLEVVCNWVSGFSLSCFCSPAMSKLYFWHEAPCEVLNCARVGVCLCSMLLERCCAEGLAPYQQFVQISS